MIGLLMGTIRRVNANGVILLTGGVGYQIILPRNLTEEAIVGAETTYEIYTHVREDQLVLFGFANQDQKEMFLLLLGVNNVGPKAALSILGYLDLVDLKAAILDENATLISRAPGVGKATSQKIILDLKSKIVRQAGAQAEGGLPRRKRLTGVRAEVVDGLIGLGYSPLDAERAVNNIELEKDMDLEEAVQMALHYLAPAQAQAR